MFPAERINKIKEIITKTKQIDIASLSEALNVTEVTVRRDLEKLENENFLVRTHGGAVLNEKPENASPAFMDENSEIAASRNVIGQIASLFIGDNSVIFLSQGAVNRYIGRNLKGKKNVTVVTNDLLVIFDIAVYAPEVNVICPGGKLSTGDMQLFGRDTDQAIKSLHYNIAFIDVDGVSLERGYTVSNLEKAYIAQDIMAFSDKTIAVCDYKKFNVNSFAPLGNIKIFKSIISNEQTPEEFKEFFFTNQIQLFCTFDTYRR
jgi:DeoR family transcriptional regulator, fructose operon transcriptional repressor